MPEKLDPLTRAHVASVLPDAIRDAMQKYIDFLKQDHGLEIKDYQSHVKACKDALSHLEMLFRLAHLAHVEGPEITVSKELLEISRRDFESYSKSFDNDSD